MEEQKRGHTYTENDDTFWDLKPKLRKSVRRHHRIHSAPVKRLTQLSFLLELSEWILKVIRKSKCVRKNKVAGWPFQISKHLVKL